jgi:hypothetical protein
MRIAKPKTSRIKELPDSSPPKFGLDRSFTHAACDSKFTANNRTIEVNITIYNVVWLTPGSIDEDGKH